MGRVGVTTLPGPGVDSVMDQELSLSRMTKCAILLVCHGWNELGVLQFLYESVKFPEQHTLAIQLVDNMKKSVCDATVGGKRGSTAPRGS